MAKISKKKIKITSELIETCTHSLGELGVPFALCFEDIDHVFHNSSRKHALTIMRDTLELQDKIDAYRTDQKAEKLSDPTLHPDDDDESVA